MQNLKRILQSNTFILVLFVFLIFIVFLRFLLPVKSAYSLEDTKVFGKIEKFKIDGNFLSMTVLDKEKIQVFYYFSSEDEKEEVQKKIGYGITVSLSGVMSEPSSSLMPHTFDYKEYLRYQKINYVFTAQEITFSGEGNIFQRMKTKIYHYISKYPHADYLLALLLGDTSGLELDSIRENGISHLFAVSGMHISLFAMALRFLLRRFGAKKDFLIFLLLFFYAFLVGFTPSVMRSVFFFFGLSLNKYFRLGLSTKRIFLYVFMLLVFLNPFYIMDIGFQYSFLICFTFFFVKPKKRYFANLLQTSAIAFFISLPISALHFYEVNVLSILWNMFFIPFVTFVLYPACFLYVLAPFLGDLFQVILEIFQAVNTWCQNVVFGKIVLPYIFPLWWLFYILSFFLFLHSNKKRYVLLCFLFIIGVKLSSKLDSASYVYFLDVGQGDSALIISPYQREVLLIDTGGKVSYNNEEWMKRKNKVDQGETIVSFLASLGISKIDLLVLTHGDYDHAGNALSILENIEVENILLNSNGYNSLEKEIASLYSHKIVSSYISDFFDMKKYEFVSADENESSIILQIRIFQMSFLFMGDATISEEKMLLHENISSDVIKLGHHGSKTSSDKSFLEKVQPSYAIISAGKNNRYHHPSKETIQKLEELSIPYYETSVFHTMWFKICQKEQKFYTY